MAASSQEMQMKKLKAILCGTGATSVAPEKDVAALIKGGGAFMLDVRTKIEARKGTARGATNIPLLRLKHHYDELLSTAEATRPS
jgi:rhodanese-related sulfurtransferase